MNGQYYANLLLKILNAIEKKKRHLVLMKKSLDAARQLILQSTSL